VVRFLADAKVQLSSGASKSALRFCLVSIQYLPALLHEEQGEKFEDQKVKTASTTMISTQSFMKSLNLLKTLLKR
jgi:hypothetical protein